MHKSSDDPIQSGTCAAKLAALAAPERLRILQLLSQRPHNVGEIGDALAIPLVNLSHHLAVLRQNAIVEWTKQGRFVIYQLAPSIIKMLDEQTECLDLGCCQLQMPGLSTLPSLDRASLNRGDEAKE